MAIFTLEGLDGRLVVEHRRDDVAVVGCWLLAHDDPVPVADGPLNHRVADDLQQEQLALADDLPWKGEDVVHDLLGGDRDTGGDPAEYRDEGGGGPGVAAAGLVDRLNTGLTVSASVRGGGGGEDLDRPGAVGILAQEALSLECQQLVRDAAGTLQSNSL